MRKITIILAVSAVCIAAALPLSSPGQAETITIVRGTVAETIDTAKSPAGGIHFIRPVTAQAPAPPRKTIRKTHRHSVFVAGDTLWIRSARTGHLTACFTGSSGMVGKTVIRCTGPDAFGR